MNTQSHGAWHRVLTVIRAVIVGLLVGMVAANIWPLLLLRLGVPLAAGAEVLVFAVVLIVLLIAMRRLRELGSLAVSRRRS